MKITHNPSANPLGIDSARAPDKAKASEKAAENERKARTTSGSQVTISERAQLMNQASEVAHGAADVRPDRVASLKAQIRGGTYQVDSGTLAEKILQDHVDSDFGKNNL